MYVHTHIEGTRLEQERVVVRNISSTIQKGTSPYYSYGGWLQGSLLCNIYSFKNASELHCFCHTQNFQRKFKLINVCCMNCIKIPFR